MAQQLMAQDSDDSLPLLLPSEKHAILTRILKRVSRSFYLTMRVLPAPMAEPVSLAYLLARAADSITDSPLAPQADRQSLLHDFRSQLRDAYHAERQKTLMQAVSSAALPEAEKKLLACLPKLHVLLRQQDTNSRKAILAVLDTLTSGMLDDLQRFATASEGQITALQTSEQLEHYCYQVAGCVGEFWSELLATRLPATNAEQPVRLRELGIELGKALQLTNILRDVPADLRIGRCYLPLEELHGLDLQAEDLLSVVNSGRSRPLMDKWCKQAMAYYNSGEQYLTAIPRHCLRLRLAVAWPMLIGMRTLSLLAGHPHWLEPAKPVKVSRLWVYLVLMFSPLLIWSNRAMKLWFDVYRRNFNNSATA